jgi:4-amino-4-deoxy-L-arabinose transferase-like glycosyltransferase
LLKILALVALLAIGFGLRAYDLTDEPIDFHPTRQLRSAIIARGMYYAWLPDADPTARELALSFAASTGQYEPPLLETLVAFTYRLAGSEHRWIARLYNTISWLIAGTALFDLARRMAVHAAWGSALVALAYFLLLPFGVQASRSFQPDPGMVMWIVLAANLLYRWSEEQTWRRALLFGLFAGLAVLTKAVALYIVAGAAVSVVIYTLGLRGLWRKPQVYAMAAVTILPAGLYYLTRSGRASEFFNSWTVALSHLLLDPATYARWLSLLVDTMGLAALLIGLVGVLIARPRPRALLLGLWVGYLVYGLFLPYQMYTHNYYHLQLIPIIALSLVPVVELLLDRLQQQSRLWQAGALVIILIGLLYPAIVSVNEQRREDHRNEPAYWQEIASYLPADGKILALTQDYGYRLMYYGWRKVTLWPNRGERAVSALRGNEKEFGEYFARRSEDKSYFLITAFNQFEDQPDLEQYLEENYPRLAEGIGYRIYDLLHPLE